MCRLLRNRVSAQQARERKKSYVSTLESKSAGQDEKITQLQQRVKTVERENVMLRQIIKGALAAAAAAAGGDPVTPRVTPLCVCVCVCVCVCGTKVVLRQHVHLRRAHLQEHLLCGCVMLPGVGCCEITQQGVQLRTH